MDLETEKKSEALLKKTTNQVLTQIRDMENKRDEREVIDMESIRNERNIFGNNIDPQVDEVDTVTQEAAKQETAKQEAAKQEAAKQKAAKRRLEEDTLNATLKLSPKRTRAGRRF